jgi:hypothetical protein
MKPWLEKIERAFTLIDSLEFVIIGIVMVLGIFALLARAIYLAWNRTLLSPSPRGKPCRCRILTALAFRDER